MPRKEWKIVSLYDPNDPGTLKNIVGFTIYSKVVDSNQNMIKSEFKVNDKDSEKEWKQFGIFRNFKLSDYQIRTEIGLAGYKFYQDKPDFRPFIDQKP